MPFDDQERLIASESEPPRESIKVLAVDDDLNVLELLVKVLVSDGFELVTADTGKDAVSRATAERFDVIILDAIMPDLHGFDVARILRARDIHTPILMLTGQAGTDYLVRALESGADDFLGKPFKPRELTARLRALARRGSAGPEVVVGRARIDKVQRTLSFDSSTIRLTDLELRLVVELLASTGEFVTHESLLKSVWSLDFDPGTNMVYTHITNIRRKLRAHGLDHLLETSPGEGYRLNVD